MKYMSQHIISLSSSLSRGEQHECVFIGEGRPCEIIKCSGDMEV